MQELTTLIKIKHATLKHSSGTVERPYGPPKSILRLNSDQQLSDWLNYFPLANFNHNLSN